MLPIKHLLTRVPLNNGAFQEMQDRTLVFIDPARVDTITAISDARRKEQSIPGLAQSIVRYVDHLSGYRLIYCEDSSQELARNMFRISHGEDPQQPDYAMLPSGL